MIRQRTTAPTTTITCKERRSHDFGYCSLADPDDDADEHARILSDITIATRIKQNCEESRERERERRTKTHIMISTLMLKARERKDLDPFGWGSATAAAGDRNGGKSAGAPSGEVEEDVNSTFLAVIPPAPPCLAESQATVVIEISKPPQSTSARKRQRGTHARTHARTHAKSCTLKTLLHNYNVIPTSASAIDQSSLQYARYTLVATSATATTDNQWKKNILLSTVSCSKRSQCSGGEEPR